MTPKFSTLAIALLALSVLPAGAQQRKAPPTANKKLYCWDQNGQRVCADALPAEAMQGAREEISVRSGLRTAEVQRALTDEERAAQAEEEALRRTEALAAETRRQTDQAMLASFDDEDELKRVFAERITLVDNSIATARYNVASLREGLVTLLRTAGERELGGKPVPDKLAGDIRQRHQQLLYHKHLQRSFETQRASLDQEIDDTLQRYRELRAPRTGAATQAP
ncbi:hypothetical protein [Xanthomonas sp. XNM01]|uniref:hypothetical protein n=1 Tax=Xanthomonas sp. XNM01 TaxID=2769289 RepID=UPI00177AF0B2|nr:hypothetical protein [Xanthomonas sp. XNM01]MBD9369865.1 hypothetical protein [Xanthomonas sp. XNM01]